MIEPLIAVEAGGESRSGRATRLAEARVLDQKAAADLCPGATPPRAARPPARALG